MEMNVLRAPLEFDKKGMKDAELVKLYRALVTPRIIEKRMLSLLRQGKISKWFSGWGQEAVSVGVAEALKAEDTILTMHRNLGVFTSRKVPFDRLFAQFQGKKEGFTSGRDRSFHFGSNEHNIIGMISHLGAQLGVADGVALANKMKRNQEVVVAFTGDGGASEGDFHEALNVASVWDLPVIFVVENNGWGLSTPSNEQFRCKSFRDKGIGYGMTAVSVDGNNILDVYNEVRRLSTLVRFGGGPILMEAKTFRIRGHEEASGTKYYPEGVIEQWEQFDPVDQFEHFLMNEGVLSSATRDEILNEIDTEVRSQWDQAESYGGTWDSSEEDDLYAPWQPAISEPNDNFENKRFIDAIRDGLYEGMKKHPNLVLMGQDIADYGGVFKATEGLMEEFGKDRVRNTPICESAIVGAGLGLSYAGFKSMIEMQFADFVSCGFNQIVNNLAKSFYRWGLKADTVIRMPTGAGVNAGPYHSQSNEAWFLKVPGLQVYYPSNPRDAKGLLLAALENPNPVLFFEHKKLYRSIEEPVNEGYFTLEPGKARLCSTGEQLTIVTYGMGVHWALEELTKFPEGTLEIIDLRTLAPLDWKTIESSVQKTGRVLVLQEDTETMGIASEIVSRVTETCFQYLDAPPKKLGSRDTPVPFNAHLEENFLAKKRLHESIEALLSY